MGNYTNEKSLVVVQDNFLTKIRNFFAKAFWSRKSKMESFETEDDYETYQNYSETFEQQEPVQKERRLYNFDADDNDYWPGDENMSDDERDLNNVESQDNEINEQTLEEYYEREEERSEAYREKQELEQKLMNYYESIKKGI